MEQKNTSQKLLFHLLLTVKVDSPSNWTRFQAVSKEEMQSLRKFLKMIDQHDHRSIMQENS